MCRDFGFGPSHIGWRESYMAKKVENHCSQGVSGGCHESYKFLTPTWHPLKPIENGYFCRMQNSGRLKIHQKPLVLAPTLSKNVDAIVDRAKYSITTRAAYALRVLGCCTGSMAAAVLLRNCYSCISAIHSNHQIWVQATERHNGVLYSITVMNMNKTKDVDTISYSSSLIL